MQYRIISNQRSGADLKFRRKGGRLLFSYTLSAIVEAQKVIKQSGNRNRFSAYPYDLRKWGKTGEMLIRGGRLFDILVGLDERIYGRGRLLERGRLFE